MLRTDSTTWRVVVGLAGVLAFAVVSAAAGEEGKTKAPSRLAAAQATDANSVDPAAAAWRAKALAGEDANDLPGALDRWERVIDSCPSATEKQRSEARSHIARLRPKVPRSTDPAKAKAWRVLVVIFRHLEFSWTNGEKTFEVSKTISPQDEAKIRQSVESFGKHVFHYTSGMLRVEPDFVVIDEPLRKLGGKGKGPFAPAPHLVRWATDPLIAKKQYDTVFCYVKFNGDKGPAVPAQFVAGTYASLPDVGGAGFVTVPWHTNYPFPGEADGEMEIHEWLHQVDWMFCHVLGYADELVSNPDQGRHEGDKRPGGDPEYARKKGETSWMRFYQHIMEDHITRRMWSQATMRRAPARKDGPDGKAKTPDQKGGDEPAGGKPPAQRQAPGRP